MPGVPYCWTTVMTPKARHITILWRIVRRKTNPSLPCIPMVETPVVRFCGEIILEVTAPDELAEAIKTGDKPISLAATT